MRARTTVLTLALAAGAGWAAATSSAAALESCSAGRDLCEAICTPVRAQTYYAGSNRRCTASCGPRWQQCLRTGTWVHLEDDQPGYRERVSRW